MGKLTTHVLDTASGKPAAAIRIELFACGPERRKLGEATTNADGRCDRPLLEQAAFTPGRFELVFHVGAYFAATGAVLPDPPFLEEVVIRFGVADPGTHYHVPLLVSPWSFSTYRGS